MTFPKLCRMGRLVLRFRVRLRRFGRHRISMAEAKRRLTAFGPEFDKAMNALRSGCDVLPPGGRYDIERSILWRQAHALYLMATGQPPDAADVEGAGKPEIQHGQRASIRVIGHKTRVQA